MAHLISAIIVLLTAITISGVAAYVSVTGMVAIFASAPAISYIVFTSLEVGKLVAAQWLHSNWKNPSVSFLHKAYMTAAVVVLMVITAFGIYGFLAKGHLEQKAPMAGLSLQIAGKEQEIKFITVDTERLNTRLTQLDANIDTLLKGDKAERANQIRRSQQGERREIERDIKNNNAKLKALNEELMPIKMSTADVDAKLGPIKFVAELFGWQDTEAAVRSLILMIMFVFDPLAVMLLLSGVITLNTWSEARSKKKESAQKPEPTLPIITEEVELTPPQTDMTEPFQFVEAPPAPLVEDMADVQTEPEPVVEEAPKPRPKPKRAYKKRAVKTDHQREINAIVKTYSEKKDEPETTPPTPVTPQPIVPTNSGWLPKVPDGKTK